jgi:hypothetical protein
LCAKVRDTDLNGCALTHDGGPVTMRRIGYRAKGRGLGPSESVRSRKGLRRSAAFQRGRGVALVVQLGA